MERLGGSRREETQKEGYIEFLFMLYPESLIRDALGLAKADYRDSVKKTLTHVFVSEVKRLV